MNRNSLDKKGLVVAVILLFIGMSVVPSTGTCVGNIDYNNPPTAPIFLGQTRGVVGEEYRYTINSTDPDGDDIYYIVLWEPGVIYEWFGPYPSGEEVNIGHTWDERGTYYVLSQARDIHNTVSGGTILEVIIGEIIYVDDDNIEGPWNGTIEYPYQYIQDGIDNASEYDTVFVYNGMYYENVIVDKTISLIGENRDTTVINGSDGEIVVNITADGVTVSGFTVQGHTYCYKSRLINIESDENIISGNIFIGNIHYGVYIYGSEYNNISSNVINGGIASAGIRARYCNFTTINNNSISVDGIGIYLSFSNNNDIIGNTITSCDSGIYLSVTRNNTIYRNIITNNYFTGITSVSFSANNTVILNDISYNEWFGIVIMNSFNDKIVQNNFIGHDYNAYFYHELYSLLSVCEMTGDKPFIPKIYWDRNYWDEPRLQPFFITGLICFYHYIMYIYPRLTGKLPINWVNFDMHPAQEPYDISMGV